MMKNVLIASTYYESRRPIRGNQTLISNEVWLDLQRTFIKKNTTNYDFAVYLNCISDKSLFNDCIIIGQNDETVNDSRLSHRNGLRASIEYFRQNSDKYDCFCILDSDCFPIRPFWVKDTKRIVRKLGLKFAAVLRLENGEVFPHPSGILIPSEYIHEDIFHFPDSVDVYSTKNIIEGKPISDTGSMMSFWDENNELMGHPLVRSNVINLHPVYAGIYGDVLYHHGLGSRVRKSYETAIEPKRGYRTKSYWQIHGKHFCHDFGRLFDMITTTPQKFIDNLRGEDLVQSNNFMEYFNRPKRVEDVMVPKFKI